MENLKKLFYLPTEKREESIFFSIVRNIHNILNTRSSLSLGNFLGNPKLTVINFGLPSFTHLAMESKEEREILCKCVEKSIRFFEHRLSYIDIEFSHYDNLKKEAKLSMKAVYCNDDIVVNIILKIAFWEFVINDWQI
jgi:type VI secretion system lysozyme-like protein